MIFAKFTLSIEDDLTLEDDDLDEIDIGDIKAAIEKALPELPKGAVWKVEW